MRNLLHETLNKGAPLPVEDDDSLDQSRDEDIYVLTPSHASKGLKSTQKSRAKSLSQSRKSQSKSPSRTQEISHLDRKPVADLSAIRAQLCDGLSRAYIK